MVKLKSVAIIVQMCKTRTWSDIILTRLDKHTKPVNGVVSAKRVSTHIF